MNITHPKQEDIMTDYRELSRPPLKLALAEFKFSKVMNIESYLPAIQEQLRDTYPLADERSDHTVKILPGDVKMQEHSRWAFIATDHKSSVEISENAIICYCVEYPGFDVFSEACKRVLSVLHDVVQPALLTRVGIRYSNLMHAEPSQRIAELVSSDALLPDFADKLGATLHQNNETLIKTQHGQLSVRTLYGVNNVTILADIGKIPARVALDTTVSERLILDIDHFWQHDDNEPQPFEVEQAMQTLSNLHDGARKAFWTITTDIARNEKWA